MSRIAWAPIASGANARPPLATPTTGPKSHNQPRPRRERLMRAPNRWRQAPAGCWSRGWAWRNTGDGEKVVSVSRSSSARYDDERQGFAREPRRTQVVAIAGNVAGCLGRFPQLAHPCSVRPSRGKHSDLLNWFDISFVLEGGLDARSRLIPDLPDPSERSALGIR